jgi:hypothetical protein
VVQAEQVEVVVQAEQVAHLVQVEAAVQVERRVLQVLLVERVEDYLK